MKTKQDLDWPNLTFSYLRTDYRFVAKYRKGAWDEGQLIEDEVVNIHEGATSIHYAQQCFEGLKAQTSKDGKVLLFRPELNAARMATTADRLLMPIVPKELFLKGVEEAVRSNYAWIPPYGSGAALYIRPVLFGMGENLGLKPAPEYEFRVFVSPVGPYYKGESLSLISLAVVDFDRTAPKGTGCFKAGANYAGGLLATRTAQKLGASEALYLDPKERRFVDEAGSANVIFKLKNENKLVTPKSESILPSVTRRSVMEIAEKELGFAIEERPIDFLEEVSTFEEIGACGTAAVISPVAKILHEDNWYDFTNNGDAAGPVMDKLYQLLTQLQKGEREDVFSWTKEVQF